MSKYWCKPCKTFVLDTKLGKSQHESSVRHKSSMDRTLRELNRSKIQVQRNEREAKRILNQIDKAVSGESGSPTSTNSSNSTASIKASSKPITSVSVQKSSTTAKPTSKPVPLSFFNGSNKPGISSKTATGSKPKPKVLGMLPDGVPIQPMSGAQAKTNVNRITKPQSKSSSGFKGLNTAFSKTV
ncbi:uncharacterized protein V2V93DRAFT_366267 [Kockiozyma suomiensis]|uniref:uncharacterized protein n=1 Tax=Kockiozyma suomiensis TaxID=1337062 RepID=UPI003342EDBC